MLQDWVVVAVALTYIGLLFLIASYGDRISSFSRERRTHLLIYPLSLAIYCTSWTFFGSVGLASRTGYDFLTIYVGPIVMIGLLSPLVARIVQLAKAQNITSIADFIAARYGKGQAVAATVALIAIIGTIPYIALQLKAVSASLETILAQVEPAADVGRPLLGDIALYVAMSMAAFAVLFGTRHIDATEHQDGLMLAVATESIVKLVAFLAVGIFVTFWMFGGPVALFTAALERTDTAIVLGTSPRFDSVAAMTLLSFLAIIMLPRQFHVGVVENNNPSEIKRAAWVFPIYLILINLFVVPIAIGGLLTFAPGEVDSDMFVLALPLKSGSNVFTLIAFVGGLSAATAMVIVESVALSIMISNDIVMPFVLQRQADQRAREHRLAAADGAPHRDLRHPGARLHVLPLGRRRPARRDRPVVVCGDRAARARLFRRPGLAPRHRARRHRRHVGRLPDLGLYAAAAELRRCRLRRPVPADRRAVGHSRAAAAAPVRPRPAAAGARRAVEPADQRRLLRHLLVAARALADRAPAGQFVRAVRPRADGAELPAVALVGDRRGTDRDGRALSRRGTDPQLVCELRIRQSHQPRARR
jgi:Na+/proline symporter